MTDSSPDTPPADEAGPEAHLVINDDGSVCVTGLSSLDVVVALQESGSRVVVDAFEPSGATPPAETEDPDRTRTTPDRVAADQRP